MSAQRGARRSLKETLEARLVNCKIAMEVAYILKGSFGPKGLDKLIIDPNKPAGGALKITKDASTIMASLPTENYLVKLLAGAAELQRKDVGDGAKLLLLIVGALLEKGLTLLEGGVSVAALERGYLEALRWAERESQRMAWEGLAVERGTLLKTVLRTRLGEEASQLWVGLLSEALKALEGCIDESWLMEESLVVKAYDVGMRTESLVLLGALIEPAYERERMHPSLPGEVSPAKIALLDYPLEASRKTRLPHHWEISSPRALARLKEFSQMQVQELVKALIRSGANVVLSSRRIDELPQHYLAREGVLVARNVPEADMVRLARATGGSILKDPLDIAPSDLGSAQRVAWQRLGSQGSWKLLVEGPKKGALVTLVMLGSSVHDRDAVLDAFRSFLACKREGGRVVGGGGAYEVALAQGLRKWALSLTGLEQLAVQAFADALEEVPIALAQNSGLDPLSILQELRASAGRKGFDALKGKCVMAKEEGLLEPLATKLRALRAATELAVSILRTDRVIRT